MIDDRTAPYAALVLRLSLAFLFFAVPMGEVFVPQLMEWTANFAVFASF